MTPYHADCISPSHFSTFYPRHVRTIASGFCMISPAILHQMFTEHVYVKAPWVRLFAPTSATLALRCRAAPVQDVNSVLENKITGESWTGRRQACRLSCRKATWSQWRKYRPIISRSFKISTGGVTTESSFDNAVVRRHWHRHRYCSCQRSATRH